MRKIALYTDEDVRKLLVEILRERGYDVISAEEAGMLGKDDEEQLQYAMETQRTILTHNIGDYVTLAKQYAESDQHHFGIVVSDQIGFKELLRRILRLFSTYSAEDMLDRFEWLQNFK